MIRGFWLVEFFAGEVSFGKGVVVLQNNQVLGGDSAFYCEGEYHIDENNLLDAKLSITRHNPFIPSVFGDINYYELEFKKLDVQKIMDSEIMYGNMVGHEDLKVHIKFEKLIKAL